MPTGFRNMITSYTVMSVPTQAGMGPETVCLYFGEYTQTLMVKFKILYYPRLIISLGSSLIVIKMLVSYEGCSNMNASSFITFFTYVLRQNGKRFYKGLYVTFKLAQNSKKNTVCLTSYSPSNEGHVSILTNSMLQTYTSDIDERIILR